MSAFDFDELDRAVSGALSGTPKAAKKAPVWQDEVEAITNSPSPIISLTDTPVVATQSDKTIETTEVNSPAEIIKPHESIKTDEAVNTGRVDDEPFKPAPRPIAPAARRSSGRFMDMIHPSSDMRSSGGSEPTVAPQGHISPSPAISLHSAQPITQPVRTAQVQHTPQLATASRTAPTIAAPVIDSFITTPRQSSRSAYPVEVPKETATFGDELLLSDWQQPLESPFLPDAKVEKRPLGGPVAIDPEIEKLFDEPEEKLLEAPDDPRLEATTMPDPIDFADTVFAKQTDEEATEQAGPIAVANEEKVTEVFPEPTHEEAMHAKLTEIEIDLPLNDEDDEKTLEPTLKPETETKVEQTPVQTTVPKPPVETPVGPTSISQQYVEKAPTETESGAIYDTENYHQPLAHPVKKKSGIWVIVWILLLVILGAGAGAAFYIFVLPIL